MDNKKERGSIMPIYIYECLQCGHTFELVQKMNASNPECEKCRGETRRQISQGNFRLKGKGWSADGYSKKEGE